MVRLFDRRLCAVLLLAAAVAACDDEPTPTGPSGPAPTVTDTFTGTIAPNGAGTHTFTVQGTGAIVGTLKNVGDDNTLVVSFALGNWDASRNACSVVLANDSATAGAILQGTMTAAGTLCARIGDVGNIAAGKTAGYTIEVLHP